jgi:hypothetical protein
LFGPLNDDPTCQKWAALDGKLTLIKNLGVGLHVLMPVVAMAAFQDRGDCAPVEII